MLNQLIREYIERKVNTEFVTVEVYFIGQDFITISLYDIQNKSYAQAMIHIPSLIPFPFYSLDSITEKLTYKLFKMRYYAS